MEQLTVSIGQFLGISSGLALLISLTVSGLWAIYFNSIKEGQKAEFQAQIENLKAKNEKLNYITKTQFDAEFKIYQEISESSFLVIQAIRKIDRGENYKIVNYLSCKIEEFENVMKQQILLEQIITKNAPFIQENMYKEIENFHSSVNEKFKDYNTYEVVNDEVRHLKAENIMENFNQETEGIFTQHKKIIIKLREYLQSLKVQED